MLVEKILDKLNLYYDNIAKPKHGNSPEILWGDLITRIVASKGKCSANSLFSELSTQTFNRMVRKCFPVKLNGGNQTWYFYLLTLIDYKLCGRCNVEKPFTDYHKDRNASSIGICSICKECVSIEQNNNYTKYIVAHKKSYDKNYGKIRARQQLYKGQRSLRVPIWYDSQKQQIEDFYAKCPEGYQVDHIIPLKGREVSGLHVISNLQYLPIKENLQKGNKYSVAVA